MTRAAEHSNAAGAWGALVRSLSHGVDRPRVFDEICDAGRTTGGYVMMSVLSAAIATLGLLLSSPAVVIGAMLLSPLMAPIILLGFSFWMIDWGAARRAIQSLFVGFAVAFTVAVLLTWASPLREPTAEILARTRPTLFDLLIAAFSGVAGGYAVIRRRGETFIGVAIATAVMPPIAAVGFGVGTANWTVTRGSLLLLATNLVAIALAAAAMAALYGFRPSRRTANRGWVGRVAVILVVGALCVPLTLSLNTIALESQATIRARSAIRDLFGKKARITYLTVRSVDAALQVESLVATAKYVPAAPSQVARELKSALGVPVQVSLDQVVLADPAKVVVTLPKPTAASSPASPTNAVGVALQALHDAVPFQTEAVGYDPTARKGVVLLGPESGLDLTGAMKLESGLRLREGLEGTEVIPPSQPLPPITLTLPEHGPIQFGPELATDIWALRRWRTSRVVISLCGLGAHDRRRPDLEASALEALKPLNTQFARGSAEECPWRHAREPYLALTPR